MPLRGHRIAAGALVWAVPAVQAACAGFAAVADRSDQDGVLACPVDRPLSELVGLPQRAIDAALEDAHVDHPGTVLHRPRDQLRKREALGNVEQLDVLGHASAECACVVDAAADDPCDVRTVRVEVGGVVDGKRRPALDHDVLDVRVVADAGVDDRDTDTAHGGVDRFCVEGWDLEVLHPPGLAAQRLGGLGGQHGERLDRRRSIGGDHVRFLERGSRSPFQLVGRHDHRLVRDATVRHTHDREHVVAGSRRRRFFDLQVGAVLSNWECVDQFTLLGRDCHDVNRWRRRRRGRTCGRGRLGRCRECARRRHLTIG